LLVFSAIALLFVGILPAGALAPSRPAKRLVIGLSSEPIMLDPGQYQDLQSLRVISQIFEPFIEVAQDSYRKVPGLVERWQVSSDGLIYTFHLRRGVKFHDGSMWNAEVAKFNFDRQVDRNHPYYSMGTWSRAGTYLVPFIEKIEVADEYTLRMTLKTRNSSILDYLNHGIARMASMEAIKKWGREFPLHPVGTGPFKFVSWEKGVRLVLERNPDHWAGPPQIDQLTFVGIPEAPSRLAALRTGTIDVTLDVPVDDLARLQQDSRFQVKMQPTTQVLFIVFNFRSRLLEDRRIRHALNYAVDKEAIVRDILKNTGVVSKGPISPAFKEYFEPQLHGFPYNPARARQLLADSGWPADRVLTFLVPESGSGMQAPQAIGTVVQANLQAVGVRTRIQTYEWGTYLTRFRAPEGDLSMMSWNPPVGDPVVMLYSLLHTANTTPRGWNAGFYDNPQVDTIIDSYTQATSNFTRAALLKRLQTITQDDPPWVFIDHEVAGLVMARRVKNLSMHPNFMFIITKADVE
jgi:peptide/nickel transport system substrate-binding protein